MLNIGILGASGYTGYRLAKYLSRHAEADIAFVTSRKEEGRSFSELYGALGGICDLPFITPDDAAGIDIDVLFTCAPDQVSMRVAPGYLDRGVTVIDLAGDYRMDSGESYEQWYGKPHVSPDILDRAVYGLTELNRDAIRNTKLVSNPGCYPTSVILGLTPLIRAGLVDLSDIYINAVSGISGAGRELKPFKLFYEADSNILPYGFGRVHKHVGEMEQELGKVAGSTATVTFAPHVGPLKTGILSTMPVKLVRKVTKAEIDELYDTAYGDEFFVRYHRNRLPESKYVADSNFCDIGCVLADGSDRAMVVSTICNLGKGASGQAVQNMNVIYGFDEREGLL